MPVMSAVFEDIVFFYDKQFAGSILGGVDF